MKNRNNDRRKRSRHRHWKSFLLDWNVWSCIWVKLQVEGQGWSTLNPCRPLENLLKKKKNTRTKGLWGCRKSGRKTGKGRLRVSSLASVTVVRTVLSRNLKKGLIWPTGYLVHLVHHERKPRTLRQELQQRPQENTVYCLAPHGLLSLLPHSTRDYWSRSGTTRSRLGSSTLIIDQENAHRHTHRPVWRRKFLSWCFQLSVDSTSGVVHKN